MTRLAIRFLGALLLTAGLAAGARGEVADPMPRAPLPADAVISPGDVIAITVVGEPELSRRVTVTDDGKVPIAFVGEVKVAGLKPAQAADAIRQALSRYLLKPEVAVDLVEANRASVFGRWT
jgi:polysaccharide export outer membrane protein